MTAHALSFPYFLYPNNQNDGDVEEFVKKFVTAGRQGYKLISLNPQIQNGNCFENYV